MTFSELVEKWAAVKVNEIREATMRGYVRTMRTLAKDLDRFGDIRRIKRKDIQANLKKFGKDHTRATVKSRRNIASQVFDYAVDASYIEDNPCWGTKIPPCMPGRPKQLYTISDIQKLMTVDCPQYKKDMIELAFRTGLRVGEIIALQWDDIDWEHKQLYVCRTLSANTDGHPVITEAETKTPTSVRCIDLDVQTVDLLSRRYTADENGKYIFHKKNGTPYSRQAIRIQELCIAAGIKPKQFRSLRTSHISYARAGVGDIACIQRRAGHAHASTTDRYILPLPGDQKAITNYFETIKLHKPEETK